MKTAKDGVENAKLFIRALQTAGEFAADNLLRHVAELEGCQEQTEKAQRNQRQHKMKTAEVKRQLEIEMMAREAAKTSGILKALDQAIQHGERDAKEYAGAFDAVTDSADLLQWRLEALADEINEGKLQ